jgi:hypothetical protein
MVQEDFDTMASLVTLAVLFLWDCSILTHGGRPALMYSHDEIGVQIGAAA